MESLNHDTIEHTPVELDAGDGVVIRELSPSDDQEYLDRAQENIANLEKSLAYIKRIHTIDDVSAWREDGRRTVYGIWKDNTFVGEVNVGKINDQTMGVAYWIDKAHRRQGITTRAVAAVTQKYTSEGYAIEAEAANASSDRLVQRLGYSALPFDPATFNGRFVFRIDPQKQPH